MAEGLNNPYAAPKADLEQPIVESNLQLASRGARLGAYVLDTIIIMVPLILAAWFIELEDITDQESWFFRLFQSSLSNVVFTFIGFLIYLLFNGYLLVTCGQTIGKLALKIRIVDLNGSRTTAERILWARTLVPYLLGLVPIFRLVDALFIFRADRRCVHDFIAGTQVVKVT